MKAGELRHKITIESRTNSQDAYGAVTETWATHVTAWASIEPVTAKEYFEQGKVIGEVTTKITIRYQSGITSLMRVAWGSKIYGIIMVGNTAERNKEIMLLCKEVS